MQRTSSEPFAPAALRGAIIATLLVLVAALIGAAVRVLPWVLDPTISWATLAPFARSLAAVAVEAAVLTGWPVGWALAASRLVERGEMRVLASLGESPTQTIARLTPQALAFVGVLAATSFVLGRDASAPGGVVRALLAEGRASCGESSSAAASSRASTPKTRAVPFVAATWLCAPEGPRLAGRTPMGGAVFTATSASVSDDLRRIDLDDANVAIPIARGDTAQGVAARTLWVRVRTLSLNGLAPFAQASSLPPFVRALVVSLSGIAASAAAVFVLLRVGRRRLGSLAAVIIGAAGPLAALGVLRGLEVRVPETRPGAWLLAFALVPVAAVVAVAGASAVAALLPVGRRAGTK